MHYLDNFISLLRNNKENRSNEIISQKIALGNYLADAKFGYMQLFSRTKSHIRQGPSIHKRPFKEEGFTYMWPKKQAVFCFFAYFQ